MKVKSIIDLAGHKYNKLTVIELSPQRLYGKRVAWVCECECGKRVVVTGNALRSGNTKSCGCLNDNERLGNMQRTHGMRKTPTYNNWTAMKQRCYYIKNKKYADYGGRGIFMCDEWKGSFEAFLRDMGPRPFAKAEIDRIDNNGPYCKDNCRWVTRRGNMTNTRCSVYLTIDGVTREIHEWAKVSPASAGCILQRVRALGWDHKSAVETPPQRSA